ncbi:MAG: cadmium-translocating P-type ATPase [Proteobacteria bacterium]|nr:cadmium-translocating P-type ATPase [Pseudomonadota bacterium]
MNKILYLRGLTCPNCAARIEHELQRLDWVRDARITLLKEELAIDLASAEPADIETVVQKIVHTFEPDVRVTATPAKAADSHGDQEENARVPQLVAGAILAVTAASIFYLVPERQAIGITGFILAYLLLGYDVVIKACKTILSRQFFDENLLMTVATIGAFCTGEYPEAVAVMLLYQLGEWFQDKAVERSKRSIADMMDICPDTACVLRNGTFATVSAEAVTPGELVLVKPGEKVPLDGIVKTGDSRLDTRALTGESKPRSIHPGDEILSGTVNLEASLQIEVTKASHDSTAAKVVRLVEDAASHKAPSEAFITKFARYYTPAVVTLALLIAVIPGAITGEWTEWFRRACIFLVISCPCALVISIPLSYFSGIGIASKHGILVKGGNYLDALSQVRTVVFDKTGTLTKGSFEVTHAEPARDLASLRQAACYAEQNSNHPIAQSIRAYCKDIAPIQPDTYTEIPGKGVRAVFGADTYHAGNAALMQSLDIPFTAPAHTGTVVHVARNAEYLGSLTISDALRPEAADALKSLRNLNIIKTAILSGDAAPVVSSVADELAMDTYQAELLPADKVSGFKRIIESSQGRTAYVGDGINDAPVLACADVGISMGAVGSDAAVEASDIVLMSDDLSLLPKGIRIARKTHGIVIQNITFALSIKLIFLVLGAFGIANLWTAVFADVGVMILAVLNAMRMLRDQAA